MLTVKRAEVLLLDSSTDVYAALRESEEKRSQEDWPQCAISKLSVSYDDTDESMVAYELNDSEGSFALLASSESPIWLMLLYFPQDGNWHPLQCTITPSEKAVAWLRSNAEPARRQIIQTFLDRADKQAIDLFPGGL